MNQSIPLNATTNNQIDGRWSVASEVQNPCVHVAMVGARMHYAVPVVLERAGILGRFYTDTYIGNKPFLKRLFNIFPVNHWATEIQKLNARAAVDIHPEKVISFDFFGIWYWWRRRSIRSSKDLITLYARAGRAFAERVARRGLSGANVVYGFNGASLEIFRCAKQRGIICILEQTLVPRRIERKLLHEETIRWPGWQPELDFENETSPDPLLEREEEEWALANRVVCGSAFVTQGLQALSVESKKCQVLPYGIDVEYFRPIGKPRSRSGLNVLFVGEVGLRKGIPYLLEALRLINSPEKIRARLVGTVALNHQHLAKYTRWCEVAGPVPRSSILEIYSWADVFVLPSICEGSATVVYEALAMGLSVICTLNTGSVVRDGTDGFIVPIREPYAIAEKLQRLANEPSLCTEMSRNARHRACEFSLEVYGQHLLEAITAVCYSEE